MLRKVNVNVSHITKCLNKIRKRKFSEFNRTMLMHLDKRQLAREITISSQHKKGV